MTFKNITISLPLFAALFLSACLHDGDNSLDDLLDPNTQTPGTETQPGTDPDPDTTPKRVPKPDVLHKSESCDEFKTYLTQNLIDQYLEKDNHGWRNCPFCITAGDGGIREVVDMPTAGGGGGTASNSSASPGNVTGTNNQEAGVDELDKLKTDSLGNMYLVQGSMLIIVDAFPPQNMQELSRLALKDNATGLFLDEANNRLVILTENWEKIPFNDSIYGNANYNSIPQIKVLLVDISDLTTPVITRQLTYEGNYQSSRFINQRLHLVMNYGMPNIDQSFATRQFNEDIDRYWQAKNLKFDSLKDEIAALRAQLAEKITTGVSTIDVSKILPRRQIDSAEKSALLACTDVYHPEVSLNTSGILSVISLDSNGENQAAVGALASGAYVYASEDSLYVAQTSNGWWWSVEDQKTAIHKFTLSATAVDYQASGIVAGVVNDQFSFSEYNGNLRVATTESYWPLDSTRMHRHNNLYVLQQNAAALEVSGAVEKFALEEQIYSARFIGDKGFVVTFRQIDPLFAFDLSDPANPVLKGELEIPGFSTYMHPVGENYLLTIGKSGNEAGAGNQTQLQLFDVSDISKPIRLAAHVPDAVKNNSGWTYSTAEYDHHAFTYSAEDQVLAIPLNYYNYTDNASFAGIVTFKIDPLKGITENGSVQHKDFLPANDCTNSSGAVKVDGTSCYYYGNVLPDRSVIMSDAETDSRYLFSISQLGIKANDLNLMSDTVGSLKTGL